MCPPESLRECWVVPPVNLSEVSMFPAAVVAPIIPMNRTASVSFPSQVSPHSRLWLGLSLLFAVLRAFPSLCYPIARDQATFCFIGQRLWEGKLLYLDLWDNKPPGIFYIYAGIVKVFGPVMWSVGVVDILWLLIISILIFKFAEKHLGTAPAVIAVVVHATWRVWSGYWDAAQPENFLVLFVMAAYFLSSHRGKAWWLCDVLSGMLFGAAFWVKYNAVAFVPLLVVLPYLDLSPRAAGAGPVHLVVSRREWMKRVGVWTAAFALSVAVLLVYFVWVGAWPAMKEIQFQVLPRYNALAISHCRSYWRYVLDLVGFCLGWWSVAVAVVALIVAWRLRQLAANAPVFLATAMGALCTGMQARLPSYSWETCYPFFAMLWGYLAVMVFQGFLLASRRCWGRGLRLATVLIWVAFANLIYLPLPNEIVQLKLDVYDLKSWRQDRNSFYRNYPRARPISHYDGQMHVIQYLGENSTPQDGVLVWGSEPLIYFLAQRRPPTRFVSNLGLISLWTPPAWREEFIAGLQTAPPKYIVVARDDKVPMISFNLLDSEGYLKERFPALLEFVARNYHKVDDHKEFAIFRHD